MASKKDLLRNIPKVDELLSHPKLAPFCIDSASLTALTEAVREVLETLRESILAEQCEAVPTKDSLAYSIIRRMRRNATPSLRRIVNATGVILHTNLGRAPLAQEAVQSVCDVADSYSTLEYNVDEGVRGSRYSHVVKLLQKLTGAEDVLVVNNNASAVLLILSALAAGKEVIVSRGELVEIGGAFRIPEVMEQSGATLREVGATNRTRAADYNRAIDPERTGALLKAHTSNFKIMGFTEEVSLPELVELGQKHNLPVLYDLGSGSLISLSQFGILDEPSVADSMATGADVVCFSGDKLLGGPQAGIILGRADLIAAMKRHPLTRALRIDKLTLAALEATLRIYADPETAKRKIPTLRMLSATREELRVQAERLAAMLGAIQEQITVVDEEGQVGGGSVPTQMLPAAAIEIAPEKMGVVELEQFLRRWETPIVARIARDRLLIDPRCVEESDYPIIADCLTAALA